MKKLLILACALFALPGAFRLQDAAKKPSDAKREDEASLKEETYETHSFHNCCLSPL
jgi:hypothetical protein